MKSSSLLVAFAVILFATACSSGKNGNDKKVVVFSSGKMNLDQQDKTLIHFEPGNQHNELEIELGANQKSVTVKTDAGEKTYEVPDNALYLLNLKADTIIGSYVNFGSSDQRTNIGADELDHLIDSTQKLMTGENASDDKKTYNLPPNSIKKISTNLSAHLLSPYKNIPYEVSVDEKGNPPEYYKFFTNTQKRESLKELIDRLSK